MRVRLVAVGDKMPDWVGIAVEDYRKRLGRDLTLDIVEIPAGRRGKGADVVRLSRQEGELMLGCLPAGEHVIALDVQGRALDTLAMANRLEKLMHTGKSLALLVGGPEGLAPDCLARADERWSLSALTLPHPLVRVVIAEQLYRCWSVIHGHPYHR